MMQTDLLPSAIQTALDYIPSGLTIYRSEKERLIPIYRNPAYYQVTGFSEEHIAQIRQGIPFVGVHEQDLPGLQEKGAQLLKNGGTLKHTFRILNDRLGCYRWLHIESTREEQADGSFLLYCAYTDVSEERQLEGELTADNEKLQNIINAIPGGVAIYRVTDIFENVYFSNGVAELLGYTVEEYRELMKRDALERIYPQDAPMVVRQLREAVRRGRVEEFECRKQHRNGSVVWVRIQAKRVGELDCEPLLQCVFYNITTLKETQMEMNHLINSIPGGVASCQVKEGEFFPLFYSDGIPALSGYTRPEFDKLLQGNVFNIIYEEDRARVARAGETALATGEVLNLSYRTRHKNGSLIWIRLNGRRIGPLTETVRFYASFTGESEESRMYQTIANEAADSIYVIDRESYELLYFQERTQLFPNKNAHVGDKCYAALHGRSSPCPCCNFQKKLPGVDFEINSLWNGRVYRLRYREILWNGIPSYIQYLRDVTEEVQTRQEKERLEQYFRTLVESLPGGVAVVRCQTDGTYVPEFLSAGFSAMIGTTPEQTNDRYRRDAMAGVHPEDLEPLLKQLKEAVEHADRRCELTYRLQNGSGGYIWVKNTLSMLPSEGGILRQYMFLRDITEERKKQERIRKQYKAVLMQHYRMPGPNALVVGHCNVTRNRILEINDYSDHHCFSAFGIQRETFFNMVASLIVEPSDRRRFLSIYLNEPMLAAFHRQEAEQVYSCLIQLPGEETGRYVQFKVSLVKEPDTGDITGILTVTDITEQAISEQVLCKLSNAGYDHIVVLDLLRDRFEIFANDPCACCVPPKSGSYSEWTEYMLNTRILPKDQINYKKYMDRSYIAGRLAERGTYTFDYSVMDDEGTICVKRMTVFEVDLRLGRVCLARTDVTESIREQQSLLNMLAYTFEIASFINVSTGRMVMYTRQTVLEDLSPYIMEDYDTQIIKAAKAFGSTEHEQEEISQQLKLGSMMAALEQQPGGYDFVCPRHEKAGLRYKKINILWGDRSHQTVCVVRADVTEMLAEERKNKQQLEHALALAEAASQAKTAFLSSMSHDIRTPMNAIMGMTTLASAHMDDRSYVEDCLGKISISSKHLLNLINDILEMSRIERDKVKLNLQSLSLRELLDQVITMIRPQAAEKSLRFQVQADSVTHEYFYGDILRMNQILINILGNAVKFTPTGGSIILQVEECAAKEDHVRYRYTIQDTGIGMSPEVLSHVFEPFTRGHNVGRTEGTGLGLSITKKLVDQMGGTISVTSREGEGSKFQVELEFESCRVNVQEEKQKACTLSEAKILSGRHFLVVEDNEINAEILSSLLEMYDASSVVRSNGAEALLEFSDSAPGTYDAILMDIQMPVMNGYEAARAIRALARADAGGIPIIAMTANAFAEDVQAALESGMNAHIAKPIDVDILKSVLQNIISKSVSE